MKKKILVICALAMLMTACKSDPIVETGDTLISESISAVELVETEEVEEVAVDTPEPESQEVVLKDVDYRKVNDVFTLCSNLVGARNYTYADENNLNYDELLAVYNQYKDLGYDAWRTDFPNASMIWGLDGFSCIDKWGILDIEDGNKFMFAESTLIHPTLSDTTVILVDGENRDIVFEVNLSFLMDERDNEEFIITKNSDGLYEIYYLWTNHRGEKHYINCQQGADGFYTQINEFVDYPEDDSAIVDARSNSIITDNRVWNTDYEFDDMVFSIPQISE